MPFVVAQPEIMAAAANDVAAIGSAISAANAAAAAPTTALATAAADEVSVAIAALFSADAKAYQALSTQVAAFHQQFVQALNAAASTYAGAEAASANALQAMGKDVLGAVNARAQTLLGHPLTGTGSNGSNGTTGGTAATGGGPIVADASSAPPLPNPQTNAASLTNGHAPLGDGIALIMGGSGIPTPYQRYAESAAMLYLQTHGFTGTPQVLTTPELIGNTDTTMAAGSRILTDAIINQIHGGGVTADNPVVVFGYSQSSAMSTFTMEQLHAQGVPSDLVHFVLVGNSANPNGGIMSAFDIPPGSRPSIPAYDITFGNPTPNNLYPTDVYTLEYDLYADFPRYPINLFSTLNAVVGAFTKHLVYLALDPSQITNAILLPTTGDTMVNYYMIPSDSLPLLDPLRLIPIAGQPLYDLLEPDMRILVNLGYGSITDGWNQGPANVETPMGLFPTDLDWSAVLPALANGAHQGVTNFVDDLINPSTYQITPLVQNPVIAPFVTELYRGGYINNPHPASLWDVLTS